jgi:hypothetical protein
MRNSRSRDDTRRTLAYTMRIPESICWKPTIKLSRILRSGICDAQGALNKQLSSEPAHPRRRTLKARELHNTLSGGEGKRAVNVRESSNHRQLRRGVSAVLRIEKLSASDFGVLALLKVCHLECSMHNR